MEHLLPGMPAKSITINLLNKDNLSSSPVGRLISWAITYGRYIMIGTEVIVLLAFISRFSLDRKLTDLKEQINQKQAILIANSDLETEIKLLQKRLTTVRTLIDSQGQPLDILASIQMATPPDIQLQSYSYNPPSLIIYATAGTAGGFSQFIVNLNSLKLFSTIEMKSVKKIALAGIEFQIATTLAKNLKSK